jgi:hypothetical protein
MTTFAQYLEPVDVAMREQRGLRKGQTFFDILREMEPELADRLTGTADDPFYNGGKLAGFSSVSGRRFDEAPAAGVFAFAFGSHPYHELDVSDVRVRPCG